MHLKIPLLSQGLPWLNFVFSLLQLVGTNVASSFLQLVNFLYASHLWYMMVTSTVLDDMNKYVGRPPLVR
jgi:hypothetical protein